MRCGSPFPFFEEEVEDETWHGKRRKSRPKCGTLCLGNEAPAPFMNESRSIVFVFSRAMLSAVNSITDILPLMPSVSRPINGSL